MKRADTLRALERAAMRMWELDNASLEDWKKVDGPSEFPRRCEAFDRACARHSAALKKRRGRKS